MIHIAARSGTARSRTIDSYTLRRAEPLSRPRFGSSEIEFPANATSAKQKPAPAQRAPHSRPIALLKRRRSTNGASMPDRQQIYARTLELIEPYNKKGIVITEATRFAQDLEWDSLTVLDFVANVEDEFDVIITMNMQAEIETVGQLVDALVRLTSARG